MPRTKTLLTALALAGALSSPALAQDDEQPRKLEGVAVVAEPSIAKGTLAVYFRTDRALGRKQNGRSLAGWVGLAKGQSSVMTDRFRPAGEHCYVGYVKAGKLRAAQHTTVRVNLGDETITKKTTVVRSIPATKGGAGIGC